MYVDLAGSSYTLAAKATDTAEGSAWTAGGTSSSFTITAAAISSSTVVSFVTYPSGTITAGATLTATTVLVTDQYGNYETNTAVAIATTSPQTALTSGTTPLTTSSSGVATFSNLIEDFVGTYNLTATVAAVVSKSQPGTFIIGISAATEKITFLTGTSYGPPSSAVAGVAWSNNPWSSKLKTSLPTP